MDTLMDSDAHFIKEMRIMINRTDGLGLVLRELAIGLRSIAEQAEQVAALLAAAERPRVRTEDDGLCVDRDRLTVSWHGHTCYFAYSIPFRLMERLAQRPNHYVTHEQLLSEIWVAKRTKSAIRNAVNQLRSQLKRAGMSDLARAIDGTSAGRYALILHRARR